MSDIIAIGGAAFSAEPRNLALERYMIDLTGKDRANVLLIPTARGDDSDYVARFYAACESLDVRAAHLPFFGRTPGMRELLLAQDLIFVGGGNTKSMLAVWHDWGLPAILREASESGTLVGGVSAGAICWFEQGLTDSWAGVLKPLDCMGWLEGSCCPHYDGEVERRPAYHALVADGQIKPGFAIEDGVAVHFAGGAVKRVVTKRAGGRAFRVSVKDGAIMEAPLDATLLRRV